jgi:hypothetical protein
MARPDKVFVAFRGIVATNIGGVFGDGDLVTVKNDGSGKLVVAGAGEAEGVIWTPEGKSDSSVSNFKTVTTDQVVTVYRDAQFTGTTGLADGDTIWTAASGDVVTSEPAATATRQKIGTVLSGSNTESRLIINVAPVTGA